jgi:hypothetical protein
VATIMIKNEPTETTAKQDEKTKKSWDSLLKKNFKESMKFGFISRL